MTILCTMYHTVVSVSELLKAKIGEKINHIGHRTLF